MASAMGRPTWIPARFLPGLGALMGVSDAPRSPGIYARAMTMLAWARGRGGGPPGALSRAPSDWRKVCELYRGMGDAGGGGLLADRLAALRVPWPRSMRTAVGDMVSGSLGGRAWHCKGAGTALYQALWLAMHGLSFATWLLDRSRARRWWPSGGAEWASLPQCRDFNCAWHLLRTVVGGNKGRAGRRSDQERADRPRACCTCGSLRVAVAATTPSAGHSGLAWCAECLPVVGAPGCLAGAVRRILSGDAGDAPRDGPDGTHHAARAFIQLGGGGSDPCPLCGLGEDSSEHLLCWCPAVCDAWHRLWAGRPPGQLGSDAAHPAPMLHHCAATGLRGALGSGAHPPGCVQGRLDAPVRPRALGDQRTQAGEGGAGDGCAPRNWR